MEPIQDLCNVLRHIDEISDELVRRTDEISDLLANYDMDAPVVDELLSCISSRNDVIESLNSHHQQMSVVVNQLTSDYTQLDDIVQLRNCISEKLNEIIEKDQLNQNAISRYRDLVELNISSVLKGKKISKAYNVVPHRKAVFVDMTNR